MEYKDLQSDYRITNAYIHCGWIANPAERAVTCPCVLRKVQYEFIDNVRGEVAANYFLPKDDAYVWDANLNFHYLLSLGSNLRFYPLVGFTVLTSATKGDTKKYLETLGADTSSSEFGFNAGAGLEYLLTPTIKLNLEGKYQYAKDSDWPVVSVGIVFGM